MSVWCRWPYPFLDLSSPYAPLWYATQTHRPVPLYRLWASISRDQSQLPVIQIFAFGSENVDDETDSIAGMLLLGWCTYHALESLLWSWSWSTYVSQNVYQKNHIVIDSLYSSMFIVQRTVKRKMLKDSHVQVQVHRPCHLYQFLFFFVNNNIQS